MVLMFFVGVAFGITIMAVVGINRSRESSLPVEAPSAASGKNVVNTDYEDDDDLVNVDPLKAEAKTDNGCSAPAAASTSRCRRNYAKREGE